MYHLPVNRATFLLKVVLYVYIRIYVCMCIYACMYVCMVCATVCVPQYASVHVPVFLSHDWHSYGDRGQHERRAWDLGAFKLLPSMTKTSRWWGTKKDLSYWDRIFAIVWWYPILFTIIRHCHSAFDVRAQTINIKPAGGDRIRSNTQWAYVHLYVCMWHMHMYIHTRLHVYTIYVYCTCMYEYMYVLSYMYIHTYVYTCICIYASMYICVYVYVCICVYVYMCIHIYLCICMNRWWSQ